MQEQIATTNGDRRTSQFRNTAYAIGESRPYFDAVHTFGLMAAHGRFATARTICRGNGPLDGWRKMVDFVQSSYLGLDNHPMIITGAIEAIEAKRSLHSSRARTQFNLDILGELEASLSEMFSARVLAFSSGMLANLSAMAILASGQLTGGRKPVIVLDRLAHISLAYHKPVVAHETRVESIMHNDIDALERLCQDNPVVAYVCDGVYSTGGYSPIRELRRLQERYELFLYVDDAHGISIFGRQGEGFARPQFPQVLGERTIIAASLTEGFGASGGILMLGATEYETLFRRYAHPFAFSAAPNLAAVGAALGSCKIHRSTELGQLQGRLVQRVNCFDRRIATAEQGNSLPVRTIIIGSEADAIAIARALLDCGFYTLVTAFPTIEQGMSGIRVCITAEHEVRDIERLCDRILATIAETTGKPYPLR